MTSSMLSFSPLPEQLSSPVSRGGKKDGSPIRGLAIKRQDASIVKDKTPRLLNASTAGEGTPEVTHATRPSRLAIELQVAVSTLINPGFTFPGAMVSIHQQNTENSRSHRFAGWRRC